jgi:Leucine-rich repeat (LRR) protein
MFVWAFFIKKKFESLCLPFFLHQTAFFFLHSKVINAGSNSNITRLYPSTMTYQRISSRQSLTRRMRCLLLAAWLLLPLVASQDEKTLLVKFYDSTGGDDWTTNTNWNSKERICSWFGVICEGGDTETSGVVQIILKENNLNGAIPPDLWRLPKLTRLSVGKNSISSAGFEGLDTDDPQSSPRSPIEQLEISENHLTEITGIGHAHSTLKAFNINKNQIDSALPVEFYDLTNLETMYIAFNQITGTLPALIGKLSRLTELYAFDNAMTGSIPSEIGLLGICQILGLGHNAFTGSLPTEINEMVNIRDLSIHHATGDKAGVGLSGPVPTFGDMPFLKLLFLDGNSLSGTIPSDFLRHNKYTNAQVSVGLARNNLTGIVPKSLERFESLTIYLVGNRIDEIPPELCDLGGWMGGGVEEYNCDAILCGKNTYSEQGRSVNDDDICQSCNDDYQYLGATTCSTAPSQREPWRILAGFYLALTGDKWEVKDGWEIIETFNENGLPENSDVEVDVCNGWYGVICDGGEITEISLPQNGLFGTIPDSIFALPSLQVFDISGNNVQITDFKAATEAKNLTSLVLSNVKVQKLEGIGGIEGLRLLYLDGLDTKGPLPDELFDLTNLRILHLQHGSFSGPLPSGVGQLSNLELWVYYLF